MDDKDGLIRTLANALKDLDQLTVNGARCNCEKDYVCVDCNVKSALAQYEEYRKAV